MSRTFRRNKQDSKTVRDGQHQYRCRCEYCINVPYRDRKGLTVKEDLCL